MKLLFTTFFAFAFTISAHTQSLDVAYESDYQSNSSAEFPLKDGVLSVSQSLYMFGDRGSEVDITTPIAFDVSNDRGKIGFIRFEDVLKSIVFDASGKKLSDTELDLFDASDETIHMTVFNSGEFILRDNVANYSFFDAAGNQRFTLSVATQSQRGERPSQISNSVYGESVVLYNPDIQYDGTQGSRALIVDENGGSESIFDSRDRIISHLKVSGSGKFITVASSAGDGNDYVQLFDRFGNELLLMETGMNISGFDLSKDGQYLTIYSSNRVQVYRTSDQERLGSSTSRTSNVHAVYSPEDGMIVALGGQVGGSRVSSPEITAIHLEQRKIERQELSGTISFTENGEVTINRTAAGSYKVEGINKPIVIQASF